jgi:hypothetical protein
MLAFDLPCGVQVSSFGSFDVGTRQLPDLGDPFQEIVARVEEGIYHARLSRVFAVDEIAAAHRML